MIKQEKNGGSPFLSGLLSLSLWLSLSLFLPLFPSLNTHIISKVYRPFQ